jgi:hypothetical protein
MKNEKRQIIKEIYIFSFFLNNINFNVIPEGSLQLSVQILQASAKILTG